MDDVKVIALGRDASNLLNDETFQRVLAELEQQQYDQFLNTDPYDDIGREKTHAYAIAIKGIKAQLETWKTAGEIAKDKDQQAGENNVI